MRLLNPFHLYTVSQVNSFVEMEIGRFNNMSPMRTGANMAHLQRTNIAPTTSERKWTNAYSLNTMMFTVQLCAQGWRKGCALGVANHPNSKILNFTPRHWEIVDSLNITQYEQLISERNACRGAQTGRMSGEGSTHN